MKKIILFISIALMTLSQTTTMAQDKAWSRNSKVLSIGLGLGNYYHLDSRYRSLGPGGNDYRGYHSPYTGQFNLQMEWAVHNYVGLGFTTGFGGTGPLSHGYRGEFPLLSAH